MQELLKWTLVTLLSGVCVYLLARQTSPEGDTVIKTKTLLEAVSWIAAVFLGLLSWWFQLWRRDRKRERVRHARDVGFRIVTAHRLEKL
jgi:hypothetical protein